MAQDPLGQGADGPDERGWEGAKQDVLYSGKPLAQIAADHGVGTTTLRNRIKTFGWVRVIPVQRAKHGPKWKRPDPDLSGPNGEDLSTGWWRSVSPICLTSDLTQSGQGWLRRFGAA